MQTIICPCCLTEYDSHDSPVEYARVNKQNTMNEAILVMNSHIKGGKTLYISRNDKGEQGVDFIADIPPFIGNEKWASLFSAAPDLLKLLKDCHNVLFQFPDYQEGNLCDDVKSAIAKAEGSTQ